MARTGSTDIQERNRAEIKSVQKNNNFFVSQLHCIALFHVL